MRALVLLLSAVLLVAPISAAAQEEPDNIVLVDADDREMNAARDQARAKLPEFWRRYEADDQVRSTAALKVGFRDADQTEFMWVGGLERLPDGKVRGQLNNTPMMVSNVREGQQVTVDPADIFDWSYERGGKAWGHFTTRVLLRRAPADETAQYEGYFSDTPVEP
jgi:uncharacterized protein YegJ (DUF2314 family)